MRLHETKWSFVACVCVRQQFHRDRHDKINVVFPWANSNVCTKVTPVQERTDAPNCLDSTDKHCKFHRVDQPRGLVVKSFWLLIMRSRVRFPVLPWGFFLEGEDLLGDHGLGSLVEFIYILYIYNLYISPSTSSGQRNCATWASQPQKSVTLRPQPGGEITKSITDMWWHLKKINRVHSFGLSQQRCSGLDRLIVEVSRSHTDTSHSVGLLWTRDRPIAKTSI
jgi:hypothetical protein